MSLIENEKLPRPALSELTNRQRSILLALVYGLDEQTAKQHRLRANRPLAPNAAADVCNVRRDFVRTLLTEPLFKAEMAAALAAKRLAYMPEALDRVASIMRDGEDGVALRASETILGETAAKSNGVTVNVSQQTNFAQIRPGYVIRMPADVAPPSSITQP